jgi:hypothetical protein
MENDLVFQTSVTVEERRNQAIFYSELSILIQIFVVSLISSGKSTDSRLPEIMTRLCPHKCSLPLSLHLILHYIISAVVIALLDDLEIYISTDNRAS